MYICGTEWVVKQHNYPQQLEIEGSRRRFNTCVIIGMHGNISYQFIVDTIFDKFLT